MINSTLQLTMGRRWLLSYEENEASRVHLQKAAPKHWFEVGQVIEVQHCPTRFGSVSWRTQTEADGHFKITVACTEACEGEIYIHLPRPEWKPLTSAFVGQVPGSIVFLPTGLLSPRRKLTQTASWRKPMVKTALDDCWLRILI